jgi:hypothetical protein
MRCARYSAVYRISKHYSKSAQRMPSIYVKLYTYQMARALVGRLETTFHSRCYFAEKDTHRLWQLV